MAFPKIDGYVVTEKIGSGSYSTVYKAYTKVGARSTVAVKCVDKSRIKHSGAAVDNLVTEIRLLKQLQHPHIVQMKNFTWDDKNIYIIMEYCNGGDLSKYIKKYGRIPEMQVLYFLQQVGSALLYLQEKNVVHLDLKPHNLLLHRTGAGVRLLKLADFGFAQYLCADGRSLRGSPLYMAPEMLRGAYDHRADLWSVGVIMFECLFGRAPYSSATVADLVQKIQSRAPIHIPSNPPLSPGCRDLLSRLLQHDPDVRISYSQFFQHQYLDLENMPTKASYDKAVWLVSQAQAQLSRGRLPPALAALRAALARLLPLARAHPHLAPAVRRYMDRAEQIKSLIDAQKKEMEIPTAPNESIDTQELEQVPELETNNQITDYFDTEPVDTRQENSRLVDTRQEDTGLIDTRQEDTGLIDTRQEDTGSLDTIQDVDCLEKQKEKGNLDTRQDVVNVDTRQKQARYKDSRQLDTRRREVIPSCCGNQASSTTSYIYRCVEHRRFFHTLHNRTPAPGLLRRFFNRQPSHDENAAAEGGNEGCRIT